MAFSNNKTNTHKLPFINDKNDQMLSHFTFNLNISRLKHWRTNIPSVAFS